MPLGEVLRQLQSAALCVSAESDYLVLRVFLYEADLITSIPRLHLRHGQCICTWQIKLNTALSTWTGCPALLRVGWRKGILAEGNEPLLH